MEGGKIKSFTDLHVWKKGHILAIEIYKITKIFPREEIYCLVNQIRRAAISITSNIAEGFGRRSYKEKIQFYYMAQGSLTELKNQLLLSRDIGYIKDNNFQKIAAIANEVHKLLQGLISSSKKFLNLNS